MTSEKADFGGKLNELESITDWFESDAVDLNEALKKFERGMVLADDLKKELAEVENRVEKIKQKFDGNTTPAAVPESNPQSEANDVAADQTLVIDDITDTDSPTLF